MLLPYNIQIQYTVLIFITFCKCVICTGPDLNMFGSVLSAVSSCICTFITIMIIYNYFYSVSWANIGGVLYKKRALVLLNSELLPEFGEILDIIIYL